jgi:hypothetical protein
MELKLHHQDPHKDPLKSPDTLTVARALSDIQINVIKENKDMGGELIAKKLESLRDAIWRKKGEDQLDTNGQNKVFDQAMSGLDKQQKEQLVSSYARMGHLYEIASLSARSNFLNELKDKGKAAPGGVEELVKQNGHKSVGDLVEKLNRPVFEIVMTAHPTNVNSLESMAAQREINKALEAHDENLLKKAITGYQQTSLLHQTEKDGEKKIANLTVRDETKTALYFLGNLYEDLPNAYKNYDEALKKYADKKQTAYDPTALNLKLKLGSWGSGGDKDGNNNVTAETTLEAIALHTQAILSRYSKDLEKTSSPELQKWKAGFDTALKDLGPLVTEIGKLREDAQKKEKDVNSTPEKLNERFDALSGKLAKVRNNLDKEGFEKDLKKSAAADKEALNLLRRFRTFGFNFSKIEYRETAKEYSRVVEELVGGYKKMAPANRVTKLTNILKEPEPNNKAAELFEKKKAAIIREGAGKPYSGDSAKPIAYHTLKRMELARDFGDMIKDNVLAECGQIKGKKNPKEKKTIAQGVANILEAQFLQNAVKKDGKRPVLGIVPLFEEPDTMTHINGIMASVYENEAYKKQMEAVKEANGAEKLTQQVMIAHSDNARRSGLQAARAYIHEAHHKMRELNETRKQENKPEIQTQFFEGGSLSDAYRNGVRAISASVNAFELHDFAKFTFQGGDLLNFFNHPNSTARLVDRQISHQAKLLEKDDGKWVTKIRDLNGKTPDNNIERNAITALKKTFDDYKKHDFTEGAMDIFLSALNYNKVIKDSNGGSRVGARPASAAGSTTAASGTGAGQAGARPIVFAAGSTTAVGGAAIASQEAGVTKFEIVPIKNVRTIGYSKTWQGSGIIPNWVGSLSLKEHLNAVNASNDNKVDFVKIGHNDLKPVHLNIIYQKSPTYRDAMDRMAFSVALTDMNSPKMIAEPNLKGTGNYESKGNKYIEHLQETYEAAAKLAYSSLTGKELRLPNFENMDKPEEKLKAKNIAIRTKMLEALPNLDKDITNKSNYRAALLRWQIKEQGIFDDAHMGRTSQIAKDTVEHGRWTGASDPTITERKKQLGMSI